MKRKILTLPIGRIADYLPAAIAIDKKVKQLHVQLVILHSIANSYNLII